jgi:hypothetical protein
VDFSKFKNLTDVIVQKLDRKCVPEIQLAPKLNQIIVNQRGILVDDLEIYL